MCEAILLLPLCTFLTSMGIFYLNGSSVGAFCSGDPRVCACVPLVLRRDECKGRVKASVSIKSLSDISVLLLGLHDHENECATTFPNDNFDRKTHPASYHGYRNFFAGVKQLGPEVDHSHSSSAVVKYE
jgi:hypothetical protein